MVLRRELSGNAVGEKSVVGGTGVGYRENQRWAKKSTHRFGGDFEKPLELYCISVLKSCWFSTSLSQIAEKWPPENNEGGK